LIEQSVEKARRTTSRIAEGLINFSADPKAWRASAENGRDAAPLPVRHNRPPGYPCRLARWLYHRSDTLRGA
jgi:hypothetical protein